MVDKRWLSPCALAKACLKRVSIVLASCCSRWGVAVEILLAVPPSLPGVLGLRAGVVGLEGATEERVEAAAYIVEATGLTR